VGGLAVHIYYLRDLEILMRMQARTNLQNAVPALESLEAGEPGPAKKYLRSEVMGTLLGMASWGSYDETDQSLVLGAEAYLTSLPKAEFHSFTNEPGREYIEHLFSTVSDGT